MGLAGRAAANGMPPYPRAMDPEPAAWFRTQGSGYATGEVMVFCGVSGLKNVSQEKN